MKKLISMLIGMLAISLAICLPRPATATLMDSGTPLETGSWEQQFNESGVGHFDTIEVYMLSGGDNFEKSVFKNFTNSDWSDWNGEASEYEETSHGGASGTAATDLNFRVHFAGGKSNSLDFDFLAWYDGELKEAVSAHWNGSRWSFSGCSNDYNPPTPNAPVPEPATMLLVGSGLVGLAGFRKKFRKS